MPSVFAIIGSSGSGKTTMLEYLISRLSAEKLKVAAMKSMHHGFTVDPKGKDTWKYSDAGASVTVGVSPDSTVIIKKRESAFYDISQVINQVVDESPDIILLEGFTSLIAKDDTIRKIVAAKDKEDLMRTLEGTVGPILAIGGNISLTNDYPVDWEIPLIVIEKNGELLVKMIMDDMSDDAVGGGGREMFGFQTPELVVTLVTVLLLFGAKRLPELVHAIGSVIRDYIEASNESDWNDETDSMDEKRRYSRLRGG